MLTMNVVVFFCVSTAVFGWHYPREPPCDDASIESHCSVKEKGGDRYATLTFSVVNDTCTRQLNYVAVKWDSRYSAVLLCRFDFRYNGSKDRFLGNCSHEPDSGKLSVTRRLEGWPSEMWYVAIRWWYSKSTRKEVQVGEGYCTSSHPTATTQVTTDRSSSADNCTSRHPKATTQVTTDRPSTADNSVLESLHRYARLKLHIIVVVSVVAIAIILCLMMITCKLYRNVDKIKKRTVQMCTSGDQSVSADSSGVAGVLYRGSQVHLSANNQLYGELPCDMQAIGTEADEGDVYVNLRMEH